MSSNEEIPKKTGAGGDAENEGPLEDAKKSTAVEVAEELKESKDTKKDKAVKKEPGSTSKEENPFSDYLWMENMEEFDQEVML